MTLADILTYRSAFMVEKDGRLKTVAPVILASVAAASAAQENDIAILNGRIIDATGHAVAPRMGVVSRPVPRQNASDATVRLLDDTHYPARIEWHAKGRQRERPCLMTR